MKRAVSVKNVRPFTSTIVMETQEVSSMGHRPKSSAMLCGPALPEESDDTWAALFSVDCGSCSLSCRPASSPLDGLAALVITMHTGTRLRPFRDAAFDEVLDGVVDLNMGFTLTCDLRAGESNCSSLVKSLASFITRVGPVWGERLRCLVVQIQGSLFAAATRGTVGVLVEACHPACPFLICRDDTIALDFFNEMLLHHMDGRTFVSLSEVQSAPPGWRTAFGSSECCVTLVANSSGGRISTDALTGTATLHELPNGDTRVIQSPARDVFMGRRDPGGLVDDGLNGCSLGSLSGISLAGDNGKGATLKFNCPPASLRLLLGAHLHIGELVFDSEEESRIRRKSSQFDLVGCFLQSMARCYVGLISFSRNESVAHTTSTRFPTRSSMRSESVATSMNGGSITTGCDSIGSANS